jgi:hypothetical protein
MMPPKTGALINPIPRSWWAPLCNRWM